nr:immunoglobulin light chain junction region [Macaca mulatta]
CQQHDRFPLTF